MRAKLMFAIAFKYVPKAIALYVPTDGTILQFNLCYGQLFWDRSCHNVYKDVCIHLPDDEYAKHLLLTSGHLDWHVHNDEALSVDVTVINDALAIMVVDPIIT